MIGASRSGQGRVTLETLKSPMHTSSLTVGFSTFSNPSRIATLVSGSVAIIPRNVGVLSSVEVLLTGNVTDPTVVTTSMSAGLVAGSCDNTSNPKAFRLVRNVRSYRPRPAVLVLLLRVRDGRHALPVAE